MTTLNVQFADSTETVIVSYFAGPQNPDAYPNLGTVDIGDTIWKSFYDAQPPWVKIGMPAPQ
jgi:hypothetical protein